uniref:25S rRNA (uridine-N(3))-methyltransferase BMT5-like domain-containing protein n=1 Tax=Pseudo-nitzschia australis TaxID=44445 RepID=A0A7S4ABE6_9STRA|mmetsp:Transcript_7056/g.13848  ORF Transcript_7056/g.13848 Transcript_7056/m.13848 type:complete len:434 (+) Transcript_7056:56-1357(+)
MKMGKKRRRAKLDAVSIDDAKAEGDLPKISEERKSGPSSSSDNEPPTRNTDRLYASYKTYDCALNQGCTPCAYKIGCFDVALDKEFCKRKPNQRPEQCPRSVDEKTTNTNDDGVLGFRRGMSILTVGDGDFSFSLGLARCLSKKEQHSKQNERDAKEQQTTLVATSYETEATLRKVYHDFDETLRQLDALGVIVAYSVDATRIFETLSLSGEDRIKNINWRFHRICWNFPCTAISNGQDGQNKAMEENKTLVRKFVQNARSILTSRGDGELCICHKTKPPYNQWKLEEVALSAQKDESKKQKDHSTKRSSPLLFHSGRVVLDRFLLPPYTPRKALDRKSFPCHDACFYIFAQTHSDKSKAKRKKLFLPTIPYDNANLTRTNESSGGGKSNIYEDSQTLLKINPELIQLIRKRLINASPAKKRKRNAKYSNGGF